MVGLVVAAHGRLADELVATAEQIIGKFPHVAPLSIEPHASPEEIRERIRGIVASVDEGQGVIVLADLFGGTPCKESLMLCQQRLLEVVCGVNLPMLLKAHSIRADVSLPLPEMARCLAQYGQRNIACASELVRHAPAVRSA